MSAPFRPGELDFEPLMTADEAGRLWKEVLPVQIINMQTVIGLASMTRDQIVSFLESVCGDESNGGEGEASNFLEVCSRTTNWLGNLRELAGKIEARVFIAASKLIAFEEEVEPEDDVWATAEADVLAARAKYDTLDEDYACKDADAIGDEIAATLHRYMDLEPPSTKAAMDRLVILFDDERHNRTDVGPRIPGFVAQAAKMVGASA